MSIFFVKLSEKVKLLVKLYRNLDCIKKKEFQERLNFYSKFNLEVIFSRENKCML